MPNSPNSTRNITQGVIYVAEGKGYYDLAVQSALSLRHVEPNITIDIYTDQETEHEVFDQAHDICKTSQRAKIACMQHSRFERTLFLDCDTLILQPISETFQILDRFSLAICHDVRRSSLLIEEGWKADAPQCFCQHNSGVMFYRHDPEMAAFFMKWAASFDAAGSPRDQTTLRDLLWESEVRFWVLPEEFNIRRANILNIWEPLDALPRVLHSHHLLAHLRSDVLPVRTLEDVIALEQQALSNEWEIIFQKSPEAKSANVIQRFQIAKGLRSE